MTIPTEPSIAWHIPGTTDSAGPGEAAGALCLADISSALHSHAMVSVTGLDGAVAYANDKCCAVLKYRRENLVGQHFRTLIASGSDAAALDDAWQQLNRGQVWKGQTRIRASDGSHRWLDTTIMPSFGPDGMPIRFVAVHTDITELRQAERALRDSETRTRMLLQAADVGLWDWNLLTDEVYFSPEWKRQIGYANHEFPNQFAAWESCLHPDDHAATLTAVRDFREVRRPHYDVEFRLRHKDGSWRWIFARANFVRDSAGVPLRMMGSHTDITERRKAEDALMASEAKLRAIVNASPVPMLLNDRRQAVTFVNPAFVDTFGYSLDEIPTLDAWRIKALPNLAYRAQVLGAWTSEEERVESTGTLFQPVEVSTRCKDGSTKTVLVSASTFLQESGQEHLVVMYDITQQKHAQAALSTSVIEKEALLREVHHRVKNNLQVITSLLRLESVRTSQPDTRAVLRDMQGRIRSMALLHESLYRTGIFASVDLRDYLGQLATQAFRAQIQAGGAIRLVLDMDQLHVGMDQATPCGLLVNELVSNCIKHGFPHGDPGEVRVGLQTTDGGTQARLCVSDTGVGLPHDFDTLRRQSLGLQLVEDLAGQIGGWLDIGPGPVFTVRFRVEAPTLPANDRQAQAPAAKA